MTYMKEWRFLNRYSQQGWEALNALLKAYFFRRTNRGGLGRNGVQKSKLLGIARWLQRRIMWYSGNGDSLFQMDHVDCDFDGDDDDKDNDIDSHHDMNDDNDNNSDNGDALFEMNLFPANGDGVDEILDNGVDDILDNNDSNKYLLLPSH